MFIDSYIAALIVVLAVGAAGWLVSLRKNDVSFVDSLWSLFFLLVAVVIALDAQPLSSRAMLVLALVAVWAIRLSAYITIRNWGQAEDYRYREIRARNQPGFAFKSLYLVFGLQGLLAWFIAMPIVPAITSSAALSGIDALAAALWLIGFVFEAGGDHQLRKFKANKSETSASGGRSTCLQFQPAAGGASARHC